MRDGEEGGGLAAVQGWGGGSRDTALRSGRPERQVGLGVLGAGLPAGRKARLPSSGRKVRMLEHPASGQSATWGQCSHSSQGLQPGPWRLTPPANVEFTEATEILHRSHWGLQVVRAAAAP